MRSAAGPLRRGDALDRRLLAPLRPELVELEAFQLAGLLEFVDSAALNR